MKTTSDNNLLLLKPQGHLYSRPDLLLPLTLPMYQTLEHTSPSRRSGYSKAHLLAFVVNSLEIMVVAFSSRRIVGRWVCGLESALSCLTTDWTGWSRREGEPFHTFNTYVFSAHSVPRNWANNVGISPGLTYISLIFPNLLH